MPSHFMYHSLAISIHVYVPEYHIQFYYFANLAYAVSFAWKAFIPFFFMRKSARTSHSLKSLLWHPQRMNHSIFRISSILYIPMSITALIALYGIICLHVYPFHADSSFSILTSYCFLILRKNSALGWAKIDNVLCAYRHLKIFPSQYQGLGL